MIVLDMFEQNKILTVFQVYVIELFREFFRQLGMGYPLHLFTGDDECSYYMRRSQQGLIAITYRRTVTEKKSLKNRLRKGYN